MESWFCSSWIFLMMVIILFRSTAASPPPYTIHQTPGSFNEAMRNCFPGVLTTFATKQEFEDIIRLVSESASPQNQNIFTFWVGLRKVKNECVVSTLPLRGFKWLDGSEESQVSNWTEEPEQTCTAVRCAALKGELNGSMVTNWGLISVSCKSRNQFICKLRDRQAKVKPAIPEPTTPEPKPATPEPSKTATPELSNPATPEPPLPEPVPSTQKPDPATTKLKLPTKGPEGGMYLKPTSGPKLQGPGSDLKTGLDSCRRPHIPGARFFSLDPDNGTRIQVECWSPIQLELHCSGRPAVWRLPDDSPVNISTVCRPCEDGFHKNASGHCVDIDECSGGGAPCRHTCLNTVGSYRCACPDENGKHNDEDSPVCTDMPLNSSSIFLIPVLVAVAALVVLVVAVGVTVKCCLIRRSKKRAMKKAEKMAMKSKDGKNSFGTANEKVAT